MIGRVVVLNDGVPDRHFDTIYDALVDHREGDRIHATRVAADEHRAKYHPEDLPGGYDWEAHWRRWADGV